MLTQYNKSLATISNDLAKASFRLSVNEMRLILVAMAQMPKLEKGQEPIEIDPKQPYYIYKEDFVRFGIDPATVAREIRSACSELMDKKIRLNTEFGLQELQWTDNVLHFRKDKIDELRKKYPNSKYDDEFIQKLRFQNLLDSLPIITGSDDNIVARVVFSSGIINYISQLRRDFTQLKIEDFAGFSSFYSFRIYIMLMRHKKNGWYRVTLDDFRFSLDIVDKYKKTRDLKEWVLDVAMKDINAHSPYLASYELTNKEGKSGKGIKATHLKIRFSRKDGAIESTVINENNNVATLNTSNTPQLDPPTETPSDNLTNAQKQALIRVDEYIFSLDKENVTHEYVSKLRAKALKDPDSWKPKSAPKTKEKSKLLSPLDTNDFMPPIKFKE